MFNVTIAGNTANSDKSDSGIGGGVYNRDGAALNFTNSIIANNYHLTSTLFSVLDDCIGALDSQGYNIVSHACTISGSYSTTPPLLGALQNNGMVSFAAQLTPQNAESIRAYVVSLANAAKDAETAAAQPTPAAQVH